MRLLRHGGPSRLIRLNGIQASGWRRHPTYDQDSSTSSRGHGARYGAPSFKEHSRTLVQDGATFLEWRQEWRQDEGASYGDPL
jgi:hypothetical protein